MKTTIVTLLIACSLAAVPAVGQSGLIDRLPFPNRNGNALAREGDFLKFLTLATDQGMRALDELAAAFPPDKVAAFQKVSAQYREAGKTRKDGNIDAESFTLAGEAAGEMAKLEGDWQSYRKDGAKSVRRAHARLGLMLLADGEASTRAPKMVSDLQNQARLLGLNPFKGRDKLNRLEALERKAAFLKKVIDQAPPQAQSFTTVRRIAGKIAAAEKFQLAEDPAPGSVTTSAELALASRKIDAEIPGEK